MLWSKLAMLARTPPYRTLPESEPLLASGSAEAWASAGAVFVGVPTTAAIGVETGWVAWDASGSSTEAASEALSLAEDAEPFVSIAARPPIC